MLALAIQDWAMVGILGVVVAAGYVILGALDDRGSLRSPGRGSSRSLDVDEEVGALEFSRFEQDVRVGVERHRAAGVTDEGRYLRDRRPARDE